MSYPTDLPLCDWCQKYPASVRWMGQRYCGACALTLVANKPEIAVDRLERG